MEQSAILRSVFFFVLAGMMEIGGGYLMWLWFREKWAWWTGAIGSFILIGYGIVPTFQPASFGRVYAAYGGVYVILSLLWGWAVDGVRPDLYDAVGGTLCLLGVGVIMYVPRHV